MLECVQQKEKGNMSGVPQMMLPADMILLWDEAFKVHLLQYAEDEDLLKREFGAAYKKLTENGVDSLSVCPLGKSNKQTIGRLVAGPCANCSRSC